MDAALGVINAWKDLITKVFGEYPLSAALTTLVAIGAWLYLDKTLRPNKRPSNTLLVLLGWAVAVPIVGALMWVLVEVWDLAKAIAPVVTDALASLFAIYQKHPLLVLSLIGLAILAYFAWKRWRPSVLPNRALRFLSLAIAVTVVAHVLSPIVPYLVPDPKTTTTTIKTPEVGSPIGVPAAAVPVEDMKAKGSNVPISLPPGDSATR